MMADQDTDKLVEFPIRRLTEGEIDELARTQAEGKAERKGLPGPKAKRVVFVDSKGYPRTCLRSIPKLKDKRLHVLVMEAMLGRELQANEEVHHKDGNYLNFHWENLFLIHTEDHGAVSSRQKYHFKIMGVTVEKLKDREPGDDDDDY